MSRFGVLEQIQDLENADALVHGITIGEVIDTNDPQQMGRVRAVCPALGDIKNQARKNTPWAMYGSPFAGVNQLTKRGREETESEGPVAYGMWAIPKIGSFVLIMCIDGDPNHRVWLGCLPPQFFPHTMPHGRYSDELIDGPLTSAEKPLQPLHSNMGEAFGSDKTKFEFLSRGADNQVAYVSAAEIASRVEFSKTADDRTKGYTKSRIQPDLNFPSTEGVNWDSQIYSWTTPGFHALHMDDRAESCRMRFRTTAGNQIILDDTNERIYVSTPKGKTWIEIDESGTVDIYGAQDISIRSDEDINMSAGKTIRMKAAEGIHMISEDEIRMYAKAGNGIHIKSGTTMNIDIAASLDVITGDFIQVQTGATLDITTAAATKLTSGGNLDVDVTGDTKVSQSGALHLKAGSSVNMESGSSMDILAGAAMEVSAGPSINMNAGTIDLNSGGAAGPATAAAAATPAETSFDAFEISREPAHEPWARVYTDPGAADLDTGNAPTPEFGYDDANVGKGSPARGRTVTRNERWNR
jgi:uncharacterized protein (DUF2345 family)